MFRPDALAVDGVMHAKAGWSLGNMTTTNGSVITRL